MIEHVVLLSVPGLRPRDVHDPRVTPALYRLMHAGAWRPMVPTFPCLGGPVEASMLTGVGPAEHGVIGNDPRDAFPCPTIHSIMRKGGRRAKSSSWFAWHVGIPDVDYLCRPLTWDARRSARSPACETKPESFCRQIARRLGPFPLEAYCRSEVVIETTEWICESAVWLTQRRKPAFQHIRLPHIGFAAQRYGPESPETAKALSELDLVVDDLIAGIDETTGMDKTVWIVAGGYAMTEVSHVIHPDRILLGAGLLEVDEDAGSEPINAARGAARAIADGQLAHIQVESGDVERAVAAFDGVEGVADIIIGRERAAMGLAHEHAAPIILIARPDSCFASRLDDVAIRGSSGAPAVLPEQYGMLMCTHRSWLNELPTPTRDIDVFRLLCRALDCRNAG